MTKYVLGFMFDKQLERVVLIKKNRPEWQKGLFNGLGGKVEENETPFDAMVREFNEEAGIENNNWKLYAKMVGIHFNIDCFYTTDELHNIRTKTDEELRIFYVDHIVSPQVENLKWLIPLALDSMIDGRPSKTEVWYN